MDSLHENEDNEATNKYFSRGRFYEGLQKVLGYKERNTDKIEVGWMLNTGKANNVKICIDATGTYNNTKNAIEKC